MTQLRESTKERPEAFDDVVDSTGDGSHDTRDTQGRAIRAHRLLERYSIGDLGAYIIVSPVTREAEEHLIVLKHDAWTLNRDPDSADKMGIPHKGAI